MNNKKTLYYNVLSAKYFPSSDPFNPKKMDKPSYALTSLHAAAGFGW